MQFVRGCASAMMLAGFLCLFQAQPADAQSPDWQVVRAIHFMTYYRDDAAFAEKVSNRAEEEYERMRKDLGFTKSTDLWLWDNRVKIRIYSTQEEMITTNKLPKWSIGAASYDKKEIYIVNGNERAIRDVVVHELGHLVFQDSLGWRYYVPPWINEGVTQWLESEDRRKRMARLVADANQRNALLPLSKLAGVKAHGDLKNEEVELFYAESAGVIEYLINTHGVEKFKRLCTLLRERMRLDDAINFTYNPVLHNLEELEKSWKESLPAGQ